MGGEEDGKPTSNIHMGAYTQKSQSLTYKTKTHPKIWIINKLAFPKKPLALLDRLFQAWTG